MVNCEIHDGYLLVDCVSSNLDYILGQLEGIPFHNLVYDGRSIYVIVHEVYVYDALLALAMSDNIMVV